jgi:hypothetical protein
MASKRTSPALAALLAPLWLVGPIAIAFAAPRILNRVVGNVGPVAGIPLFHVVLLVFAAAGGWMWGRTMASVAGVADRGRMSKAGAVGFGACSVGAALALLGGEQATQHALGMGNPLAVHSAFTLLDTIAVTAVAAIVSTLVARAAGAAPALARVVPRAASSAGLAALAVDVGMYILGWRIAAPHAAERMTMVTVLAVGSIAAAVAGTAVLARGLAALASRGSASAPPSDRTVPTPV